MSKENLTNRISIGFGDREWQQIEQALAIFSHAQDKAVFDTLPASEMKRLIRRCVSAVCAAIIRQNFGYAPLAVDLRLETEEETRERLGKPPKPHAEAIKTWLTSPLVQPNPAFLTWRRNLRGNSTN